MTDEMSQSLQTLECDAHVICNESIRTCEHCEAGITGEYYEYQRLISNQVSDVNHWVASSREIDYLKQAYSRHLPDVISHALVICPVCKVSVSDFRRITPKSFGFPGTPSPHGQTLSIYSEDRGKGQLMDILLS